MTWKATLALMAVVLLGAAVVQRGYVSTLDDYEDSPPIDLRRMADGGAAAAKEGLPALSGYATGLGEAGVRIRVLRGGETIVDGAPGSGFVARERSEATGTLPNGNDVLVVANPLLGLAAPSGPSVSTLRDDLMSSLWAGAGVVLLACLGLLLARLVSGRLGRSSAKEQEGDDETRERPSERAESGALSTQ
jgi:hypothetical protein